MHLLLFMPRIDCFLLPSLGHYCTDAACWRGEMDSQKAATESKQSGGGVMQNRAEPRKQQKQNWSLA